MTNSTITRQQQYLIELARWLCFPHEMKFRNLSEDYDLLIQSKEGETPTFYDYPFPEEKHIKFNQPVEYKGCTLLTYRALTRSLIAEKELNLEIDTSHGWYHHQLLHNMLFWADEMFISFVNYIIGFKKDTLNQTERPSQTVLHLLKILIKQIDENYVINRLPLIPDLFTFRMDTTLMSYQEQVPSAWLGEKRDGFKYTYMFSRQTSRNFAEALLALLRKRFNDQIFIDSLDANYPSSPLTANKPVYCLPDKLDARITFLEEYYELNSRESIKSYSRGQLLFLFKILQDDNIVLSDLNKEVMGLAISILTGVSFSQVYKIFPYNSKLKREDLFDIKNPEILKEKIDEICGKSIGAIMDGQKKYAFIS
jgi:hypothetical protein